MKYHEFFITSKLSLLRDTLSRGAPPLVWMALVVYIPRRRVCFGTAGSGPSRVQRTAAFAAARP